MPHVYNEEYIDVLRYGLQGRAVKMSDRIKNTTFLSKVLFGGNGVITKDRSIQLKLQKKGRPLGSQSEFGAHADMYDGRTGFEIVDAVFPYYHHQEIVTPEDLEQLRFDEDLLNPYTEEQRAILRLADARDDLQTRIDTDVEVTQAMSILRTGKIAVKGYGEVDFKVPSTCFYNASSNKLSSATDKVSWLRTMCDKAKTSGKLPTMIIAPYSVIAVLLNDSQILTMLDNRRIEQDGLKFEAYNDNLVAYHGKLAIAGYGNLSLLSYDGTYTASNGTETDIFPDKTMLFASERIGNTNYGGIYQSTKVGVSEKVASKGADNIWLDDKQGQPFILHVERQSAPLLSPAQIGGWCFVSNAIA